jgi:hypothetical protein
MIQPKDCKTIRRKKCPEECISTKTKHCRAKPKQSPSYFPGKYSKKKECKHKNEKNCVDTCHWVTGSNQCVDQIDINKLDHKMIQIRIIYNLYKATSTDNYKNLQKPSKEEIKKLIEGTNLAEYGDTINIFDVDFLPHDYDVIENFLIAYVYILNDKLEKYIKKIDKFNKNLIENKVIILGEENTVLYIKQIYLFPVQ